jgi:2-dehydro-3-deoxyphosphogluconate aldolase/(4S)-4-hydroxy-2-oxoglutarate aldolase
MNGAALLSSLRCPVIPVVVIDRVADAVPLADALLRGGISALEITLRTSVGLDAISTMKQAFPESMIGAGTVCSKQDYDRAAAAGADFIVSPGATNALFGAADHHSLPFLPGAVTASEILNAIENGYSVLKFFPAETSGGAPAISALEGPFPGVSFMPTGGITRDNLGTYLALNSVSAVGGSWLTPKQMIADQAWDDIYAEAVETVAQAEAIKTGDGQ